MITKDLLFVIAYIDFKKILPYNKMMCLCYIVNLTNLYKYGPKNHLKEWTHSSLISRNIKYVHMVCLFY
jgi:hypothetical protein